MRTTARLTAAVLARAKREAARRYEALTVLVEQGLRLILERSGAPQRRKRVVLPTCRADGGVLPEINLNDNSALIDAMETRT